MASTYSDMIVNYSAVPDFNGPITGYRIYLEFTRNGEKQTLNVTTSRVLTYTVSNLYPYTDYVISYAAINKIGEGPKSAAAAAVKTKEKGKWEIKRSKINSPERALVRTKGGPAGSSL